MRLGAQKTDIVLTFNLPEMSESADRVAGDTVVGARYEMATQVMGRVAAVFEVKDFGLFKE